MSIDPNAFVSLLRPGVLAVNADICDEVKGANIFVDTTFDDGEIVVRSGHKRAVVFERGWENRSKDELLGVAAKNVTAAVRKLY